METIVQLAQAWLEHCRTSAETDTKYGADLQAEEWNASAEEAEAIIKRYIDGDSSVR